MARKQRSHRQHKAERIPWTPEPDPDPERYDRDAYIAWGRKHFGEDWYELRKTMLEERRVFMKSDPVYVARQQELRQLERKRQDGKLEPRGKSYRELKEWARAHYGEAWQRHADAQAELEAASYKETSARESHDLGSRARKHGIAAWSIRVGRDEKLVEEGKTWPQIMAWPVDKTVEPPEEIAYSSPAPSCYSDTGGYDTCPPTPDEYRMAAICGPKVLESFQLDERLPPHENSLWKLEFEALHETDLLDEKTNVEELYLEYRISLANRWRTWHENKEGWDVYDAEGEVLRKLYEATSDDPKVRAAQKAEFDRRVERFKLLQAGLSEEQIEAQQRETASCAASPGTAVAKPEDKVSAKQPQKSSAKNNKGQRKALEKQRVSRRLAGLQAEYGLLPDSGGVAVPVPRDVRPAKQALANATNSATRGRAQKQKVKAETAKPRGVSKSEKTAGSRRLRPGRKT